VPFVAELLRRSGAELCIDRNRVFSTGMSAGGIFSTALACELPGTLAAIAPVAGINATQACPRSTPKVAVLSFHGTADGIVPYPGGPFFSGPNPVSTGTGLEARPVREAFADWARFDGCAKKLATTPVADDVELTSGKHCDRGTAAKLYTVEGGGHTWPGAPSVRPERLGHTTTSIDATEMILTFFGNHPRVR
jgi:polyhydroxybutyrate depolymerase